jgi:hypothetical protein
MGTNGRKLIYTSGSTYAFVTAGEIKSSIIVVVSACQPACFVCETTILADFKKQV